MQASGFPQPEGTILPALLSRTPESQAESAFKWTKNEDKRLVQLVSKYGPDWYRLTKYFPCKSSCTLKKRWFNRLDPNINKTRWSSEEDELIVKMYNQHGGNWKLMSHTLVGRPPNVIKNHFYGALKKRTVPKQLAEIKEIPSLAEDSAVNSLLVNSEDENDAKVDLLSLELPTVAIERLSAAEKKARLKQLYMQVSSIESMLKEKIRKLNEEINSKLEM
jgi:hypothetical protein